MQIESQTHKDHSSHNEQVNGEMLYRTKWLIAHNCLHEIVHSPEASRQDVWAKYLKELGSSEEIAKQPA